MNDACWENIKPDAKGQDRALSLCISPHIGGGLERGTHQPPEVTTSEPILFLHQIVTHRVGGRDGAVLSPAE